MNGVRRARSLWYVDIVADGTCWSEVIATVPVLASNRLDARRAAGKYTVYGDHTSAGRAVKVTS